MMDMANVSPDVAAVGVSGDGTVSAAISFDEDEVTNMLLKIVDVTEDNGLKLPREFGLLVKQSLYFDLWVWITGFHWIYLDLSHHSVHWSPVSYLQAETLIL